MVGKGEWNCLFLRSVKFVVRSIGRFLGRAVCLWLQRSQGSRISSHLLLKSVSSLQRRLSLRN